MACEVCGSPCQGSMCKDCEMIQHLEDRHGVPSDHMEEDDGDV